MGDTWRVHTSNDKSRAMLLASGLSIKGLHLNVYGDNPYSARGPNGQVIPSTKLFVDNIPISYSDDEVKKCLEALGVVPRSRLMKEHARDPDGKLTNWVTGRRFIFINLPAKTLPRMIEMGPFKARLFYKEINENFARCRRCLGTGHWANACPNEEKCLDCLQEGHRKGDALCPKLTSIFGDALSPTTDQAENNVGPTPSQAANGSLGSDGKVLEPGEVSSSSSAFDASSEQDEEDNKEEKVSERKNKKNKKKKNKKATSRDDSDRPTQEGGSTEALLRHSPQQKGKEAEERQSRPRSKGREKNGSDKVPDACNPILQNFLSRARSSSQKRTRAPSPTGEEQNAAQKAKVGTPPGRQEEGKVVAFDHHGSAH